MDEYISKQAFKEKYLCCGWLPEMSKKEFDDFPAADVAPVVRCKDCIYHSGVFTGQPNIICFQMKDDDFCSYGARMDKEDEHEAN